MNTQTGERINGITIPFESRIKTIGSVGITGADGILSHQGIILGAGQSTSPFCARVESNLPNYIQDICGFHQHRRVVAVKPSGSVCLICLS